MELSPTGGAVVDALVHDFLNTRCLTIAGGTEQILLTLAANVSRLAALNFPASRRKAPDTPGFRDLSVCSRGTLLVVGDFDGVRAGSAWQARISPRRGPRAPERR